METKICVKCKEEKQLTEFAKDKYNKDGLTFRCKKCRNKHYNEYYKENPEKQKEKNERQAINRKNFYDSDKGVESSRRAHLKRSFGISLEEYNEMSERQNHICAICGGYETSYRNKVLSVDHSHKTGVIRGLLCNTCNRALGLFKEDIDVLKKAIDYLLKNEK
jgi:hypothetical protein